MTVTGRRQGCGRTLQWTLKNLAFGEVFFYLHFVFLLFYLLSPHTIHVIKTQAPENQRR